MWRPNLSSPNSSTVGLGRKALPLSNIFSLDAVTDYLIPLKRAG